MAQKEMATGLFRLFKSFIQAVLVMLPWILPSLAAPTGDIQCAVTLLPGGLIRYNLPSLFKKAMDDTSCEAQWSNMRNTALVNYYKKKITIVKPVTSATSDSVTLNECQDLRFDVNCPRSDFIRTLQCSFRNHSKPEQFYNDSKSGSISEESHPRNRLFLLIPTPMFVIAVLVVIVVLVYNNGRN